MLQALHLLAGELDKCRTTYLTYGGSRQKVRRHAAFTLRSSVRGADVFGRYAS